MAPPDGSPGWTTLALDDAGWRACTRLMADPAADSAPEPMAESVLAVTSMDCAACAGPIEAALHAVPGVARADVDYARRRVTVRWHTARARPQQLLDAITAAGHQAVPAAPMQEREAQARALRQALWRLFVAGFCMMQVMMLTTPAYLAAPGEIPADLDALMRWAAWVLSLPVVLFSAGPFFSGAWSALRARRIDMNVPVALGVAITFVAGTAATFDPAGPLGQEVYLDSMTMFVAFLLAGRWLEARARLRNAEALDALLAQLPEVVDRLDDDGRWRPTPVAKLRAGQVVRVALGQAFPGDGVLLDQATQVDESLLTGESRPVARAVGEAVVGGSLNLGAPVQLRLSAVGEGSRYQQLAALVRSALGARPGWLRVADRWAGPFLWTVLLLAAGAGAVWSVVDPARALSVCVAVLIVTCPCALSLAAPAALMSAAGALARRGVLVQRPEALEALAETDTVCLDKTGTLTQDRLLLARIDAGPTADRPALLARAASLAARSQHPLSRALAEALTPVPRDWASVAEHPGRGIEAQDADGQRWRLGAPDWAAGLPHDAARPQVVLARVGGGAHERLGFEFDEALRPDAQAALNEWGTQGQSVHLLSGDSPARVQALADRLKIGHAHGGVTPEGKLAHVAALQAGGHRVVMVGDGVNDAPVLARADVSFALAHGSALAKTGADFIVLGSRLAEVPAARRLAQRTRAVMRQNLGWSLAYNLSCVPLALLGYLPPWAAGAGMALSSLAVVLNALRLSPRGAA